METKNRRLIIVMATVVGVGILGFCVIAALSVFALSAPAGPKQQGVYLQQGRKFIELEYYRGAPGRDASAGIPSTSDKRPTLVLWDSSINLSYLELHRMSPRGKIDYATKWLGEMLEATPRNDLEPGQYCFIQGNPLATPGTLSHWCFEVK